MTKNGAKIKEGIQNLCYRPYELISGKVINESLDTDTYTISVMQSDGSLIIEGVLLSAAINEPNGLIAVPKDDSNVVIGCVDGPGEWVVLKTSQLAKLIYTCGNVSYEMDDTKISMKSGNSTFNISENLFQLSTVSESLFGILNDLITAITLLTVTTSSGVSSVPVNVSVFNTLLTRLSNLLSA